MTTTIIDLTTLAEIKDLYGKDVARLVEALLSHVAASSEAEPADALLTRREVARFITEELGYPIAFSTLTKQCAIGEGPPVARQWGRRPLYSQQGIKNWVEARAKSR
jgi:hypothetical protein